MSCELNCPICDIEHCSDGAIKNGYDDIEYEDDYYDYGNHCDYDEDGY